MGWLWVNLRGCSSFSSQWELVGVMVVSRVGAREEFELVVKAVHMPVWRKRRGFCSPSQSAWSL